MAKRGKGGRLTKQEDAFCREYVLNGNNGAAAYEKAYPKSKKHSSKYRADQAIKILSKPSIKLGVSEYTDLMADVARQEIEEFKVEARDVLREIAAIAFQDPRRIFEFGSKKVPRYTKKGEPIVNPATGEQVMDDVPFMTIKNSDELTEDDVRTIAGVEMTISKQGDPVLNVKRADKLKALQLLGTHLKLFTTKVEHGGEVKTGPVNLVVMNDEAGA